MKFGVGSCVEKRDILQTVLVLGEGYMSEHGGYVRVRVQQEVRGRARG